MNNKILANSDFFMSAFPAENGNSISGIFDLKLRKGNEKMHELTGQLGFLGTEWLLVNALNTHKVLGIPYAPNLADPSQQPFAIKQQLCSSTVFFVIQ